MRKVKCRAFIAHQYLCDHFTYSRKLVPGTGEYSGFVYDGIFHQWACAPLDPSDGVEGTYTYAIVEKPDGTIEEVLPTHIQFVEPITL